MLAGVHHEDEVTTIENPDHEGHHEHTPATPAAAEEVGVHAAHAEDGVPTLGFAEGEQCECEGEHDHDHSNSHCGHQEGDGR